jgi:hypothetical protein
MKEFVALELEAAHQVEYLRFWEHHLAAFEPMLIGALGAGACPPTDRYSLSLSQAVP